MFYYSYIYVCLYFNYWILNILHHWNSNVLLSLSVCAEQISLSFIILTYYVILPNCTAKCAFEKTVSNTQTQILKQIRERFMKTEVELNLIWIIFQQIVWLISLSKNLCAYEKLTIRKYGIGEVLFSPRGSHEKCLALSA